MARIIFKIAPFFILFGLLGCGAVPGNPKPNPAVSADSTAASYHYVNAVGSSYDLTPQKLIFTPASAENTVDEVKDDGYYTELNITLNDYTKLAAACEKELKREQNPATKRDSVLPVPQLSRRGANKDALVINLDAQAVRSLNYVLEPYLDDQQ